MLFVAKVADIIKDNFGMVFLGASTTKVTNKVFERTNLPKKIGRAHE
jgi:hypothetical protein